MSPNINIRLEHIYPLIKLINSKNKVSKDNYTQADNISQQYLNNISTSNYLITDTDIKLDQVPIQIENNNKDLNANDTMIKEIIFEWSQSKQIYQIDYLQ